VDRKHLSDQIMIQKHSATKSDGYRKLVGVKTKRKQRERDFRIECEGGEGGRNQEVQNLCQKKKKKARSTKDEQRKKIC
jgi:hypothetical protein